MSDSENFYGTQVKRAEERILGTKFCFACQRQKPADTGKSFVRGKNRVWKCAVCAAKANPGGFKNL